MARSPGGRPWNQASAEIAGAHTCAWRLPNQRPHSGQVHPLMVLSYQKSKSSVIGDASVRLALEYARHGKHRLAARVLAEAEHDAKLPRAELDEAKASLSALAKTVPARPGRSAKRRTVLL